MMLVRVLACAALLVACTYVREVEDPGNIVPREVVEVERWRVQKDGTDLGYLVLYEIRDQEGPVRFYRVLNRGKQWMGHVALDGWFSRRVPFQEDEESLGIYPMSRGLAVLYEVGGEVDVTPMPRGASEASVPRVGRE